MSTRGVNGQVLALSSRMDAPKAKKEASEIEVSFCGVKRVHFYCSIDIQGLIYKFHFNCQYFFVDTLAAFR